MSAGGPNQTRSADKIFRGSRKRLRRLKWYKHTTGYFWAFVVLISVLIFLFIPWMWQHSSHVPEHGATRTNQHRR